MNKINDFWMDFCQKHHVDPEELEEVFAFGRNSHDADVLSDLVNRGIKTATTSVYDLDGAMPVVGKYAIVLNGKNEPVCVIQNKTVEIMPFKNVSAEHAYLEGEGDRSYEYWRKVHEKFFAQECEEDLDTTFTENTEVVCETFEKVD
ncbi:ASCH domain-containing protein [Lactobacillus helveticus]|uniref:ASCH domain-containing protein n=1 Tax=Lactobacillus helveticus TaxID=1587 RepID=UPI00197CA553|nr:ASCH domain-containing protein [Lactobacillus helveticus]MBN6049070.1 ASCH domain-containing protein [Lactobacillus helveticus]MBW8008543.1 ASCH domain-containing protein [Lactobacillus helveticus]MBW8018151.1 ASCH domain-containing protein [Lactobacillus helveticus]MBW8042823.1 ASCH domain-containing protein [Lactobacillus helveticus]MBW8052186.1 ASCH domain-containing protein [Lactobacillus helveticus]